MKKKIWFLVIVISICILSGCNNSVVDIGGFVGTKVYTYIEIFSATGDTHNAITFNGETTADMILFNTYYPDSPDFAEKNKIEFPFGFHAIQDIPVEDIHEVGNISEDEYIHEYELDIENDKKEIVVGIVRDDVGGYAKIEGTFFLEYENDSPRLKGEVRIWTPNSFGIFKDSAGNYY